MPGDPVPIFFFWRSSVYLPHTAARVQELMIYSEDSLFFG